MPNKARHADPVLSRAAMRAAEQALIDAGSSVEALMKIAGEGVADYVWRLAAGRAVTVLCGPGNNGGDGYVAAEALRQRGASVRLIAPMPPASEAARNARAAYGGVYSESDADISGGVMVDCLFGSGLSRGLANALCTLLQRMAERHDLSVAVDVPSGVESDSGAVLSPIPDYALTIALGAWKRAHFLSPASASMGALKRVDIGLGALSDTPQLAPRPRLSAPHPESHKYRRGMLGIISGEMPGAAVLAARAAQHSGAGYVALLSGKRPQDLPPDIVHLAGPLSELIEDKRFAALLIGPGLGRGDEARIALDLCLAREVPLVVDADALHLFSAEHCEALQGGKRQAPLILTPHDGERAALSAMLLSHPATGKADNADKAYNAGELARAAAATVIAKGPDTLIAGCDGALYFTPPASSWLSAAGTGDVLAGLVASRLAAGQGALAAAIEATALHRFAAQRLGPAFTASELAAAIRPAFAGLM